MKSLPGRLRGRLSFANVTSCLALFIALGGTGYAAVSLPRNSVGTTQIRTNGVGKSEIKSRAVGATEVATNGIGKTELATNSVGQAEIRKDSVGAGEIRPGAVGTSELQDAGVDLTDLSTTTKAALIPARTAVAKAGTALAGNAQSVTRAAAGSYAVTFDHDVSKCFYSATLAAVRTSATAVDTPVPGTITAAPGATATSVDVTTTNPAGPTNDQPFHLLVAC